MTDLPELLRVASPSVRNTQQTPLNRATQGATVAQQADLKALALAVLGGSNAQQAAQHGRTNTPKTAQQTTVSEGALVARLRSRLQRLAAEAGLPAVMVDRLEDGEVAACSGYGNELLTDYLRAMYRRYRPLTDRQREALRILQADPALRRAFNGEPTESGYRLAVAIRRPCGRIVTGELILPTPPDLPGLADAFTEETAP